MTRKPAEHERYKELAALAEVGALSTEESAELRRHLEECDECRAAACDYEEILFGLLPVGADLSSHPARLPRPTPLSAHKPSFVWSKALLALAACVLILMAASLLLDWRSQGREAQRLAQQSDQLQKMVSQRDAEIRRLQTELKLAASRLTAGSRTPRTESDRNLSAATAIEGLREELDAARRLHQAESQAARLASEQAKRLQTDRTALEDRLRESQANLQGLERQLALQNKRIAELGAAYEKLKRDNQALFLTSQDSAILGAPDLRVVSVDNIINKSLRTKAFGRIISAEGYRSQLCLFGLSSKEGPEAFGEYEVWALKQMPPMDEIAKTTLHWKGTSEGSARRLGVPILDAVDKDRWVLDLADRSALMSANYILVLDEKSALEPGAAPVVFLGKLTR